MRDNHDGILNRLRRIEGQVTGIRKMQEEAGTASTCSPRSPQHGPVSKRPPCLILQDHVSGCVREAIEEGMGEEKAAELLEAVGRFVRSV